MSNRLRDLAASLERLNWQAIREADDASLLKFIDVCHHWVEDAEAERDERRKKKVAVVRVRDLGRGHG